MVSNTYLNRLLFKDSFINYNNIIISKRQINWFVASCFFYCK
jgi:hypothetical protein